MENLHNAGHSMNKKVQSDLYKIQVNSSNPFDLFNEWYKEAKEAGVLMPNILNLATSDGCGRVSARSLLLRQLDDDGFVIMTDGRSKKSFDIERCPNAAMTFVWVLPNNQETHQVRIEGIVKQEDFQNYSHIYTEEPLYCKIRSMICRQGEVVEWDQLKEKHDHVYVMQQEEVDQVPPHYVVYKMYPEMIEFYAAKPNMIGDRVVFRNDRNPSLIPRKVVRSSYEYDASFANVQAPLQMHAEQSQVGCTFNNSMCIQVGINELQAYKINDKNWIYYRVAA